MIVAHVISSLERGGAQEVLCSLVEKLDPEKFTSYVLYFHNGPHAQRLARMGIKTYYVQGFLCRYDPIFWYRFIRFFIQNRVDTLHALLWAGQIVSRIAGTLLGIPVISVYHNQMSMESGVRLFLDRITIVLADNIVAVSQTVAHSITTNYASICPSTIITIPNGINVEALALQQTGEKKIKKTSLGIPEHATIIGTVGRLHPVKKHTLLLRAYALLCNKFPDIYLLIIGDGPEQERLTTQASALNIKDRVVLLGNKQAYPYYHLFDCFVLASAQEGMSLALLEALFCKRACVVAHPDFNHDVIVHEHNGLLVHPDDETLLAQAIERVIIDAPLQQRLGSHGYETVCKEYSLATMVKNYEQLLNKSKLS